VSLEAGPATATALPSRPGDSGSWTVYHRDPAGTGVAEPVSKVDTRARVWTSPTLDGQIYSEPLVSRGRVYVATENDTVYALSAADGAVAWSVHLGSPVPWDSLPCGNIRPTVGITGTPVIDRSRSEIFVVADELDNGSPAHRLVGLSTLSGTVEMNQDVDPPGADPAALLQRTGLTLDAGRVVFGFGGNYGDCGSYRGRVAAVPETGGTPAYFTVDAAPDESRGSVWMGGAAPVVDNAGDIWVSTGNGSVDSAANAYDNSDGVLELSSSLQLIQFFAPSTWPADNSRDLDMSTAPVLLPDGQVLLTGKSRIVYLLDGSHLGGVGGQQADLPSACSDAIDGGAAAVGMTVYLPCLRGPVAVQATSSPPALRLLWAGAGGGPPVVAAGLVWSIGQNGTLYGLDPATGRVRQQATIGAPANHFPTPSVADGLLIAPAADNVVAFAAPAPGSQPATAPSGSASQPTNGQSSAPPAASSHFGGRYIAAIVVAALVVIIGGGWLLWRRRVRGNG
jgi:outer membrane protein assembly factor BamB